MRRNTRNSRRLALESLENRQLMAGDISYVAATKSIFIRGDEFGDAVEVSFSGSNVTVDLKTQRSNGTFDHKDQTRRIADVQRIAIESLNGNDSAVIYQNVINSGVNLANIKIEFSGGAGTDRFVNATNAPSDVYGGEDGDFLWGGSGADRIFGDEGNDFINGNQGNDTIYGGLGNDKVAGGDGEDILYGQAGHDELAGEQGNDYAYGGDGNDWIYGGEGKDFLRGENGDDTITGDAGADFIWGGFGNDQLVGGDDNDIIQGEGGFDLIKGGYGNDVLLGGTEDDTLLGEDGQDSLYGNDGNDYLDGGYDRQLDYLVGGNGNDTFRSKTVHLISGIFEQLLEEDWVSDWVTGDIVRKRYV